MCGIFVNSRGEKMEKYTENEIKAIKFYRGDVSGGDSFYGDGKAYVTLNSLFFEKNKLPQSCLTLRQYT